MAKGSMPILVGVGQAMSQWDGTAGPEGAPSPLSLAADASRAALKDAGIDASHVDLVGFVRIFEDSVRNAPHPHGHNTNLPGTLARELGAWPGQLVYSDVGGQSPQALANEMANRIHAGEFDVALIAGSEANRASKGAQKHGMEIDWADGSDLDFEDRGLGDKMISRAEIKHGLIAPAFFYALFENAIAAREGRTRSEQREAMSKLFQPFTEVAADNPYAQFPVARSEEFLATPSPDNYEFADPFLKWHIAQDAVNQGAAMLLMSEEKADALGIAKEKRVYLHGGGEASDDIISERPRLDGSWAMEQAIGKAGRAKYGHEHDIRATIDRKTGEKLIERIRWWEEYTRRNGGEMNNNPSPGNKAGGLTTILEKSLGAAAKGGTSNLTGVFKYAEPINTKGFVFMDSPGYDPCSVTGQVASGANIVCFTTGRGSVFGNKPSPSLKLATNSAMYRKLEEDMDVNCGDVLDAGVSIQEMGQRIFELILRVSSGEKSKSEAQGFGDADFIPWQVGAVM